MKVIKPKQGEITIDEIGRLLYSGAALVIVLKSKGKLRLVRRVDYRTIELVDLTLDGFVETLQQTLSDFIKDQLDQGNEIYCFHEHDLERLISGRL